jgi:hypothetical protein
MADMMKPYVRTSAGDNRAVNPAFGKVAQSDKAYKDQADETQREDYRKGGKISAQAVSEALKLEKLNQKSQKEGTVSQEQVDDAKANRIRLDANRQAQRGTPTKYTQETNSYYQNPDIKKYKRS